MIGHLHLSWLDPHKMRKMTVIGSERMVVFDDMETERKVTDLRQGPDPAHRDATASTSRCAPATSTSRRSPATEPLRIVCERFVTAVADRGPTPSDGWAGAAVVEVLEAMSESLALVGAAGGAGRGRVA